MSRGGQVQSPKCAARSTAGKAPKKAWEQSFNSLDAQREACAAYIDSQRHEGWLALDDRYDDGGYSG